MVSLSFTAGGGLFAADVTYVQKVSRMAVTPVPAAPEEVAGIANMKGKVVTILSIDALLGGGEKRGKNGGAEIQGIRNVSAVIFKPFNFNENGGQMGLLMDKPGDLIDIDENKIIALPPAESEDKAEKKICISGTAETGGKLYRIIDIGAIIERFGGAEQNPAG